MKNCGIKPETSLDQQLQNQMTIMKNYKNQTQFRQ